MKNPQRLLIAFTLGTMLLLSATDGLAKDKLPDVSKEGLVRVKKPKNGDVVYLKPGVDLSGYTKLIIAEPEISFREGWKDDINSDRHPMQGRISDDDMAKMIARGKELFNEEFPQVLVKKGWTVIKEAQPGALIVRPYIINLDIGAPDPDNMAGTWTKTYAGSAGQATLYIELYDAVSKEILVRAMDTKVDTESSGNWRMQRTQQTNVNDARYAFADWAAQLAKGLDHAKQEATKGK